MKSLEVQVLSWVLQRVAAIPFSVGLASCTDTESRVMLGLHIEAAKDQRLSCSMYTTVA